LNNFVQPQFPRRKTIFLSYRRTLNGTRPFPGPAHPVCAGAHQRKIVALMLEGFDFGKPDIDGNAAAVEDILELARLC
jgi:hypothetical protein